MSRLKREIKTTVDAGLVGQLVDLQARVSRATEPADELASNRWGEERNRQGGPISDRGVGTTRGHAEVGATGTPEPRKRVQRTTLSMPVEVGARARRLAMALTLLEERDVSLGTALSQALGLLEEDLRSRGARIPENVVELRTGKRHL